MLSVVYQSNPPSELVIIDQCQDNSVYLILQDIIKQARLDFPFIYVQTGVKGLVHAKALAAKLFNSDVLVFGEDDMFFSPNYFETILCAFSLYPSLMGLSGLIDEPPFTMSQKLRHFFTNYFPLLKDDRQLASRSPSGFNQILFSPKLYGGSSAWRREVFQSVAFEPNLILHFTEDIFFSHKVNSVYGTSSTALLPCIKSIHNSETNLRRFDPLIYRQKLYEELHFVKTFSSSFAFRFRDSVVLVLLRLAEAVLLAPLTSKPLLFLSLFSALIDSIYGFYPFQTIYNGPVNLAVVMSPSSQLTNNCAVEDDT